MESKAKSEVRKLTEFESLFLQIIEYSNQVTDENFQEYAELGYNLLRENPSSRYEGDTSL